jgi:hypothetical protein
VNFGTYIISSLASRTRINSLPCKLILSADITCIKLAWKFRHNFLIQTRHPSANKESFSLQFHYRFRHVKEANYRNTRKCSVSQRASLASSRSRKLLTDVMGLRHRSALRVGDPYWVIMNWKEFPEHQVTTAEITYLSKQTVWTVTHVTDLTEGSGFDSCWGGGGGISLLFISSRPGAHSLSRKQGCQCPFQGCEMTNHLRSMECPTVCGYSSSCLLHKGSRGFAVGWGTLLQAGRLRGYSSVKVAGFFPIYLMIPAALLSLTEMSIRNLPGDIWQPARKADNFTVICEPTV